MKRLLFGLIGLIGLGFINFSSATNTIFNCKTNSTFTLPSDGYLIFKNFNYTKDEIDLYLLDSNNNEVQTFSFYYVGNKLIYFSEGYNLLSAGTYHFSKSLANSNTCEIVFIPIPTCDTTGLITQSECNSQYSGYVSSEIYGICSNSLNSSSNELSTCNSTLNSCLQGNYTGVQWSSLYINDVQHLGASSIYINIPEEISWDYSNENDQFDLDVEGYNVDTDYIENILAIQTYSPTSDEFALSFVGGLTLILPYILITLFVIFIWKIIRKIFK